MARRKIKNTQYSQDNMRSLDENLAGNSGFELDGIPASLTSEQQRCFAARETIFREGEQVTRLHLIHKGMVKLLSYLPNGRARIVRLHARGHYLGLEGLTGQPYEHTAIAIGDVQLSHIPMSSLRMLEKDSPHQYCQLLKQGFKNLTQADRWIADFSTGGIRPRVARLVEYLSKLEYGESSNMVELLTVHEMADMLGVTPESVSRILAEFKRNDTLHKIDSFSDETYQIDSQVLQSVARQ